ncbi:SOS response-associated peptidase family protein [Kribbella sp. NPDC023972]|uniref:SOS response-associated peptidase family protein n=1 Tax=Kribbella sp. NPDC023972 TaxID=3154795 RepID=UPI0034089686
MCGRYVSTSSRANLLEQFVVDDKNADELKGPDYNVARLKAPVVIARVASDDDPVRELRLFRWGLLPNLLRRVCRPGVVPSPVLRRAGWAGR